MALKKKKLAVILLLAAVIVTAAGFFLTSSWFLTQAALPLFRQLTHIRLEVGEISWNPWRNHLTFYQFRLGPEEAPLVTARKVRGYYLPGQLLRGILAFRDVEGNGVEVALVEDEEGRWNFQRLLAGKTKTAGKAGRRQTTPQPTPQAPARRTETRARTNTVDPHSGRRTPRLSLSNIKVENGAFHLISRKGGRRLDFHVEDLALDAKSLQNPGDMPVQGTGRFSLKSSGGIAMTGRMDLTQTVQWNRTFRLNGWDLRLQLSQLEGQIAERPLHHSSIMLSTAAERQNGILEISRFQLRQDRLGQLLSRLDMTGTLGPGRRECQLQVSRAELSEEVMALLSDVWWGVNPGQVRLEGAGEFQASRGKLISRGHLTLERREGEAAFGGDRLRLPGFRFHTEQDFVIDSTTQELQVRNLNAELSEQGHSTLRLHLPGPASYDLNGSHGENTLVGPPSRVLLEVDRFDLSLLRFVIPAGQKLKLTEGLLSGRVEVMLPKDLDGAGMRGELDVGGLNLQVRDWHGNLLNGRLEFTAALLPDFSWKIPSLSLTVDHGGDLLGMLEATATWNREKRRGSMKVTLEQLEEALLPLLPSAEMQAAVKHRLAPFSPVHAEGSAELEWSDTGVQLKQAFLNTAGIQNSLLSLRLEPQFFDLSGERWIPVDNWKATLEGETPLSCLNDFFSSDQVAFSEGRLRLSATVDTGSDLKSITTGGTLVLSDLAARCGRLHIRDVTLQDDFSLYFPGDGRMQLPTNVLYCRVGGRPALRLELSGATEAAGAWEYRLAVRYLNEQLTRLLFPGRLAECALAGEVTVAGKNLSEIQVAGLLNLEKFRWTGTGMGASGQLNFELSRKGGTSRLRHSRLTLHQGPRRLLAAKLTATIPGDVTRPVHADLQMEQADLAALHAMANSLPAAPAPLPSGSSTRKKTTLPTAPPALPKVRTPLFFGQRPVELALKAQNLNWGADLVLTLSGNIRTREHRLDAPSLHLTVNERPLEVSLHLLDTPQGMAIGTTGHLKRPLPLAPLITLSVPDSQFQGILRGLDWRLNLRNIPGPEWLPRSEGTVRAELADIVIPNRMLFNPYARLLLAPVEALMRVSALLPNSMNLPGEWRKFQDNMLASGSTFSELRFHTGLLQLRAGRQRIEIEQCDFRGTPVEKLNFSGQIATAGEQSLTLVSQLSLFGMPVTIPIQGTPAEPQVNLRELIPAMTGGQIQSLIDRVGEVLGEALPLESITGAALHEKDRRSTDSTGK